MHISENFHGIAIVLSLANQAQREGFREASFYLVMNLGVDTTPISFLDELGGSICRIHCNNVLANLVAEPASGA